MDTICIIGGGGSYTAVGLTAPATAAAVRAGISGFEEHPYMINQLGDPYILAMVPSIPADIHGIKRYIKLALPAIEEALLPLKKIKDKNFKTTIIIGLPEKRPGIPENLAEKLSKSIKALEIENITIGDVRTAYKGHAAGLMAMGAAARSLKARDCEFCLVGGVDSYIDPDTLDWIEDNEQLHTPINAWGFIPGEAAGFCLLCSRRIATKYQLPVKAILYSTATTQEKNKIKTDTVCIGQGLTEAVYQVVKKLPNGKKVSQVYNDMNGESYRAEELGFMLTRVGKYFEDSSDFIAPADCWGDIGAATGVLAINQIVSSIEKKYYRGKYSLIWGSSEGGDRCSMVINTINENKI